MDEEDENEYVLEDLFKDVDFRFDDDEPIIRVRDGTMRVLQDVFGKMAMEKSALKIKRKLIESVDKIKKFGNKKGEKEKVLGLKKKVEFKIKEKIKDEPFLRTSDKIVFCMSMGLILTTQHVMTMVPDLIGVFYTIVICPLMLWRYFTYKKQKYHYFMLDFCYLVQLLLLLSIHFLPINLFPSFFLCVLGMVNGPIAFGVPLWRNSFVLHDVDKMTSSALHILAPAVTVPMRWKWVPPDVSVVGDWKSSFFLGIFLYILWQALYLLKTEMIDRQKLDDDRRIMTSLRWLTDRRPHPIYKGLQKGGVTRIISDKRALMVLVQFLYTLILFPFGMLISNLDFHIHAAWIIVLLSVCIWNGSNFYFEVFAETYSKRLRRFIKEATNQCTADCTQDKHAHDSG